MNARALVPLMLALGCSGDAWIYQPLDAGTPPTDVALAVDAVQPTMDTPGASEDREGPSSPDVASADARIDVMHLSDDGVEATADASPAGPCGRQGDSCCASGPPCLPGHQCSGSFCQLIDDPPRCTLERVGCDSAGSARPPCCDGLICAHDRNSIGARICCGVIGTRCYGDQGCCGYLPCVGGLCECSRGECLTDVECCSAHCDHSAGTIGRCT